MNRLAKLWILLITLSVLFALASVAHAQDLFDGGTVGIAPAEYRVGLYYQYHGDHERAIAEFTQVTEEMPSFGYVYAARGDSYAALAEYELALADYNTALEIYPDFVSVLYLRGHVYLALENLELGVANFISAIEQMPEYAQPYRGLADVYFEQGKYGEALVQYQTYLTLTEELPNALVLERIDLLSTIIQADTL